MFVFRIKEIRENKNVDLEDLANETGLSMPYLRDIENDKLEDTMLSNLYIIAKALQVEIRELYYTIDDYEMLKNILDELVLTKEMSDSEVQRISKILDKLLNYMNR